MSCVQSPCGLSLIHHHFAITRFFIALGYIPTASEMSTIRDTLLSDEQILKTFTSLFSDVHAVLVRLWQNVREQVHGIPTEETKQYEKGTIDILLFGLHQ